MSPDCIVSSYLPEPQSFASSTDTDTPQGAEEGIETLVTPLNVNVKAWRSVGAPWNEKVQVFANRSKWIATKEAS